MGGIWDFGQYLDTNKEYQRDADFRFTKVHQLSIDVLRSIPSECNAWLEAGNTFVESEIVIEGDVDDEIDETNTRVRAIRAKIFMKQEKRKQ